MPIQTDLHQLLSQAIGKLFPTIQVEVKVDGSKRPDLADYASSVAMHVFSVLKRSSAKSSSDEKFSNPRAVAEALMSEMNELLAAGVIGDVTDQDLNLSVAGPGFINFQLTSHYLKRQCAAGKWHDFSAIRAANQGRQIVVEFSSPNIAKPFTIGHLRSTIIGDAIARLLEKTGWQVFRDNHLGDWGTQFGKQIYAIKTWGDEEKIRAAKNPVKELVALYVKFHEEAEENPALDVEGRYWFRQLENGDAEARRLWQFCIDVSWTEFNRIYQRLDVHFTENNGRGYGESYFENKMTPVIAELRQQKLLTQSEGAELVFFPGEKYPPLMILKNDGATLYATRDLATDKFRLEQYGKNTVVLNEIGQEQALYMKQIHEIEQMLGWYTSGQRIHVGHGLYRFKDGKMSTRKGNVIWLDDIFAEAYLRVKAQSRPELDEESIWKIAIGALKWSDLKRDPLRDIVFDWDEILSLEGNSGPYVQYMYVRCQSVLEKAREQGIGEADLSATNFAQSVDDFHVAELALVKSLLAFPNQVAQATKEYAPYLLAQYLFELAQLFSSFYTQCPILSTADEAQKLRRLQLTAAVARVIYEGLELLGIQTVVKM